MFICNLPSCHRSPNSGKHPSERWWNEHRDKQEDTVWMEQLEKDVRRPMYKRVPPHVKGNINKMIVQPAMLFGMETVPVTSSHVKKLEVTEMKMCRWACGHTLRDHVRNENIKERLKVESIADRCRKARLRWVGHVKRRDQDYLGRKTLEMVPPGRRKRG